MQFFLLLLLVAEPEADEVKNRVDAKKAGADVEEEQTVIEDLVKPEVEPMEEHFPNLYLTKPMSCNSSCG